MKVGGIQSVMERSKPTESETKPSVAKLQSKNHEEILNVIDQLRAEGVSRYIDLPQLIVCGDQSSGKSSVLEAISGLDFPRKDNVCTRFATELILRRAPAAGLTISIFPDKNRPEEEQMKLSKYKPTITELDKFAEIVNNAAAAIGVSADGHAFSKDILRVEVSGPDQPHLTMVDLPGLYHASDETQNEEGVAFVEALVLSYMKNTRSVMLAVISAKNDIALQKVTAFTRRIDPKGERTLGIITKPDTLPAGSPPEASFLELARNKRMPFRLGWHVLKNRTYEERSYSTEQRHVSEKVFFTKGMWSTLSHGQVGVESLRSRLSDILRSHILAQIPNLLSETQAIAEEAEKDLAKLGQSRQTLLDQRSYLLSSSDRFTHLLTSAVDGVYLDAFFGDALEESDYQKRLRAIVQLRLSQFEKTMADRGAQKNILDDGLATNDEHSISRSDYIDEVKQRIQRNRGRELPGTYSPLIIGELFFAQAKPWAGIVRACLGDVLANVRYTIMTILQYMLDHRSVEGLLKHRINPRFSQLEQNVYTKADEMLKPHQVGHPITYNRSFIETIKKTRQERLRASIDKKLQDFGIYNEYNSFEFEAEKLLNALSTEDDADQETFACSEATDCMMAYYKVARERLVDDISSLVVEQCLLTPLLDIFNPLAVSALPEAVIEAIASEEEETRAERARLTEKVASMTKAISTLQKLDLHIRPGR